MARIAKYDSFINPADRSVYLREAGSVKIDGRRVFSSPAAFSELFGDVLGIRWAAEEHVYIACLDTRLHVVGVFEASRGSVNGSMFPVREILQKSLLLGAVNICISHNHPSGDPTPSGADIEATARIKSACDICGIGFLDHVVVAAADDVYYSFRENGGLKDA